MGIDLDVYDGYSFRLEEELSSHQTTSVTSWKTNENDSYTFLVATDDPENQLNVTLHSFLSRQFTMSVSRINHSMKEDNECRKLVDEYAEEIYTAFVSRLSPRNICMEISVCSNSSSPSVWCNLCIQVLTEAVSALLSNGTKDGILIAAGIYPLLSTI